MLTTCILVSFLLFPYLVSSFECGNSRYKDAGRNKPDINYQGWLSREGEFPYQALLKYLGATICGGVLIDDRHVLTAVHCTRSESSVILMLSSPAEDHAIILGDFNRAEANPNRRVYSIETITEHEGYDDFTMVNDIALIRLAESVEFTEYIQPICLPEAGRSFVGSTVSVSGWCSFQPGSELMNETRYVNVEISDFDECKECYKPEPIEAGMVCVGYCGNKKKHYACQGDLGGAAAVKVCDDPDAGGSCTNGGTFYLAGLMSWGYGCEDVYPGVLTDVPYYIDWINQHRSS